MLENQTQFPGSSDVSHFWHTIRNFVESINSSQIQKSLYDFKVLLITISALFLILLVYFLVKGSLINSLVTENIKNFLSPKGKAEKKELKKWENIKKSLQKSEIEEEWKVGVLEAYSLFGELLEKFGFPGNSIRERIEKLDENEVSNVNELKQADDFCQDIVKDPDFKIKKEEAEKIIDIFEKTLTDLNIF